MILVILFSLKTVESLQNGVATHFQVTPLFSMRTELLALSQNCSSVDANVWCKRALGVSITGGNIGVVISLHLKSSMELLPSKLSFFKWTSRAPTSSGDPWQNDCTLTTWFHTLVTQLAHKRIDRHTIKLNRKLLDWQMEKHPSF